MADEKIYLTSEGFLEIEEELNHLKNERRPEIIKALKDARALGDLSENADYDAARDEQAKVEGRILELEKILEKATIIESSKDGKVGLGSTVTIYYIDDEEEEERELVIDEETTKVKNLLWNAMYNLLSSTFYLLEKMTLTYFLKNYRIQRLSIFPRE